ncbi:SH3 domain protein, partial [Ostertagia ostertagi]
MATVLYDYSPLENDEIPLQKGETIEILSDADSLGWCTGRKNG